MEEVIVLLPGGKSSVVCRDHLFIYNTNHQGSSTTSIVDEKGMAAATYEYDAYGNIVGGKDHSFDNEVCYTGQTYDKTSGLYYYRARFYDGSTGGFTSQDTSRGEGLDPRTQNLYGYCAGDPVNYTDPTGHSFFSKLRKWVRHAVKRVHHRVRRVVRSIPRRVTRCVRRVYRRARHVVRSAARYVRKRYRQAKCIAIKARRKLQRWRKSVRKQVRQTAGAVGQGIRRKARGAWSGIKKGASIAKSKYKKLQAGADNNLMASKAYFGLSSAIGVTQTLCINLAEGEEKHQSAKTIGINIATDLAVSAAIDLSVVKLCTLGGTVLFDPGLGTIIGGVAGCVVQMIIANKRLSSGRTVSDTLKMHANKGIRRSDAHWRRAGCVPGTC